MLAGHCHSDPALAWAGQPQLDWERQAFLARVGAQGELLASLDVRPDPGDAPEPYVKLQAMATREGRIWVGGRLDGALWGLTSRGPQAFVALLDRDFKVLKACALDGEEVSHLQADGQGCLAAGLRKSEQKEPVVLWKVDAGGVSQPVWAGKLSPNAACRQLAPEHLVFEEQGEVWQLDLPRLQSERLPDQVWATALWQGSQWALGQASGSLAGTTSVGEGDLILWRRQGSEWRPDCRFGTRRGDFFRFLVASPAHLTLAGGSRGAFPGQPEAPADQDRASWIRLFRPPQEEDRLALGVRSAGATRAQLQQSFLDLRFDPRPGYDHFSGWLSVPDLGLLSRESSPFDHWVCIGPDGQELSSWGPPKNLPAPLEPQIFPLISNSQVMCLSPREGARWFRLNTQGKVEARQTLQRATGLRVEQIAAGPQDCLWAGREFTRKGQQRRLLGLLDQNGKESWTTPLQGWSSSGFACLALARQGQRCALLLDQSENTQVQVLQLPSRVLFRLQEPGQPQTLAWVGEQLWLISKTTDRLVINAYQAAGKWLWRKTLTNSADFQITQILPTPQGVTLVGSRQNEIGARGLLVQLDSQGVEQTRWTPACDRDLLLKAARLDASGQLWVAGEVVEDYETDVFWGRPAIRP